MQNDSLFALVQWMPELLRDGLVFVDTPRDFNCIVAGSLSIAHVDDGVKVERARFSR